MIFNMVTAVNGGGGGGQVDPQVPSAYQEVEYLICTDYQHVEVDVVPQYKLITVDASSNNASSTNEQGFAGYRYDTGNVWEFYFSTNRAFVYERNPDVQYGYIQAGTDERVRVSYVILSGNTGPLRMNFGCYRTSQYPFAGKLYRVEVESPLDDSVHILLKPCYRKSDSVIGMYDVINDVFYTNNGPGAFGKGPDVN